MSQGKSSLKVAVISMLGTALLRALAATWRIKWINLDIATGSRVRGQPAVYVLWHGQLLPLLWCHRKRKIAPMISEHRDGEIIARVATGFGLELVRGSSSRGAARALLSACRMIEQGYDVAITPDGPRGPNRSVAPGAAIIAQRSGAPLLPVAAVASRAWRLGSWDGFMIPKPFARVTVAYSELIRVPPDAPRETLEDEVTIRHAIERAEQSATTQ
jgi:lysophospholipid acyltransferase (LPLAT)-like uncharacterized protein